MINRRHFVQLIAALGAGPTGSFATNKSTVNFGFGPLKPDPERIIDLPAGFAYTVVSRSGEEMDDGLLVPGLQDGMAAFAADDGQVILVCNHEIHPYETSDGPFGQQGERFERWNCDKQYDSGKQDSPGLGGTTTIHYDPVAKRRTHIHMSLKGTENNCAGGPTPWGSWLTCEECFFDPGTSFERGHVVHRDKKHGYVFEVAASAMEAVDPVPLTQMGRFEHEAAAVDPATGIIYLTEDRQRSLLYRFIPTVPGKLREGGRLQALGIRNMHSFDTRNWLDPNGMAVNRTYEASWVDLEDPDVSENDLRLRGAEKGAAIFARGEGICYADGDIVMAATIGGMQRLGQLFAYSPGRAEGTRNEHRHPGKIRLLAESTTDSVLRHADNLTLSPWGDLVVCEDTVDHCGLVGITPGGQQYALADNAYTSSELAGICFSPDGKVMFVNIQERGMTLAVTGPWSA
jgi:secreted PhoX family phosphatase